MTGTRQVSPGREYLEEKYVREGLSAATIAKQLGCSHPTVLRWLRLEGLKLRYRVVRGDITGKPFNFLTPEEKAATSRKDRKTEWWCRCVCGNRVKVLVQRLFSGKTKSCGCRSKGSFSPGYRGTPHVSKSYWNSVVRSAHERGLSVTITPDEIEQLFVAQRGKCALSGLDLVPCEKRFSSGNWTASLDRKDSRLGYELSNVQWVHKDVNRMKWHYDQDYFVRLCSAVSKHMRRR